MGCTIDDISYYADAEGRRVPPPKYNPPKIEWLGNLFTEMVLRDILAELKAIRERLDNTMVVTMREPPYEPPMYDGTGIAALEADDSIDKEA